MRSPVVPIIAPAIGPPVGVGVSTLWQGGGAAWPPPYTPPVPVLIDGLDVATGWTITNGGAALADTVNKFQGVASLSVPGVGNTGQTYLTRAVPGNGPFNPATMAPIVMRVELSEDPEYQTISGFGVLPGRGGTYHALTPETGYTQLYLGTRWLVNDPRVNSTFAAIGSGNLDVRLGPSHTRHSGGPIKMDALASVKGRPTIIFALDDIPDSQYTIGLNLFRARGLERGVQLFVPIDKIGVTGAMTLAQLQEWKAAGAGVSPNGTRDDVAMTTKANAAAVIAEINLQNDYFAANGLANGGGNFTVYPNGTMHIQGTTVSQTSVTSDGSTAVTMASTAGISVGMRASGYRVRQDPPVYVDQVVNGTTLILTAAVPAATSRMDFTDTSGAFHTGKLYKALKDAGITFARTAGQPGPGYFSAFEGGGIGRRLAWQNYSISNNALAANIKADIDKTIELGTTSVILVHGILAADTLTNVAEAKLTEILDYVATKKAAGLLDCININDWAARDFNRSWPT